MLNNNGSLLYGVYPGLGLKSFYHVSIIGRANMTPCDSFKLIPSSSNLIVKFSFNPN